MQEGGGMGGSGCGVVHGCRGLGAWEDESNIMRAMRAGRVEVGFGHCLMGLRFDDTRQRNHGSCSRGCVWMPPASDVLVSWRCRILAGPCQRAFLRRFGSEVTTHQAEHGEVDLLI